MTECKLVYVIVTPEYAKMPKDEFFQKVFPYVTQYKRQDSAKKALRGRMKAHKEAVDWYEDHIKRVKAGDDEFFEQTALQNLEDILASHREILEGLEKAQIKAVETTVSYAFRD